MPLGVAFGTVFGGFWEAKWSQVGTKMASKMDLILQAAKIKKTYKNQWNFNDFLVFGGRSWDQKSIKIDIKNDAETRRLGNRILIDF